MRPLSQPRKEALRLLLKSILTASIDGTRAMERHIVNAGATHQERERRMNAVCAELLSFHLWRALRFARQIFPPHDYAAFAGAAMKGLAVAAVGIFTGLFDKNAQQHFAANLDSVFNRYNRCSPEPLRVRDPLTGTDPLSSLSRTLATLTGHPDDGAVTLQSFAIAEQSINTANIAEHVAAAAEAP